MNLVLRRSTVKDVHDKGGSAASEERAAPGSVPFRPFLCEGSRIPNFLNGRDGEGREVRSHLSCPNTNTSTRYEDRLCGTPDTALMTITQAMMQSLRGRSMMVSRRPRTATPRSMLSNDTRHELTKPPSAALGPGSYHIEGGSPAMGTLPPGSPSRGAVPARDPGREHRAFSSPPRTSGCRARPLSASHLLTSYLDPEFHAQQDKAPEWFKGSDRRAAVTDYRYGARYTEAGKKVATDPDVFPCVSSSGKPLLLADGLQAKAAAVPFMSKQPRFVPLPNQRGNDVRLSAPRSDEDRAGLGPGSYLQHTDRGLHGPASASRRLASAASTRGKGGKERSWGSRQPKGASGSITSFAAGTGRSQKFGPFSSTTDSAQARRM